MLGGWRTYDTEAALPHSDPQLRTRKTVLDSWTWLGATEGLGARGISVGYNVEQKAI